MGKNILSVVFFLIVVAAIFALIFLPHLFASNPILIAVQIGAVLLMLWARFTFGFRSFNASAKTTQGGLVTHGPYRYWRHPIYISIIYFVWAGQVENPGFLPIGLAAVLTLGLFGRMLLEEQFLKTTYEGYTEYMRTTKRFIPFLF